MLSAHVMANIPLNNYLNGIRNELNYKIALTRGFGDILRWTRACRSSASVHGRVPVCSNEPCDQSVPSPRITRPCNHISFLHTRWGYKDVIMYVLCRHDLDVECLV